MHGKRKYNKKIQKILQLKQSACLKTYIKLNTHLRYNAKNDFEKELFKFKNNTIFRKTMENVKNWRVTKLTTRWECRYSAAGTLSESSLKKVKSSLTN